MTHRYVPSADWDVARNELVRFRLFADIYAAALRRDPTHGGSMPERAAMLRASLDLTRALARLRRPGATWSMTETSSDGRSGRTTISRSR